VPPPSGPCSFPSDTQLQALEQDSTTLAGETYDVSAYQTPLTNVHVLSRTAAAPPQSPTQLIGVFPFYEPPGEYLLFLLQAQGNGTIAEPAHGLAGMFHIAAGNLILECFDGQHPRLIKASGVLTEADLIARIPSVLRRAAITASRSATS
jgi:hypothetical protein